MEMLRTSLKNNVKQYAMLIALIVITIFFQIVTKGILLVPQNIANLIQQNAHVVILAVGMLLCILTGGNIDLSVGSTVACVGAVVGTLIISYHWNTYLVVGIGLLVGLFIGIWQGFWIAYVRIPPFIVTLAGMLIFRGINQVVLNGMTLAPFPADYLALSTGFMKDYFGTIPNFMGVETYHVTAVIIGAIVALVYCVMQIFSRLRRAKNNYKVESFGLFIARLAVVVAVILIFCNALASYKGIPTVLIILTVLVLAYSYFTQNAVSGRHIYALGGNEKAAMLSGIKTKKVFFGVYVNVSVLAAVAGMVFAARLNAASPLAGQSFELDAIASCFIGGASAFGGIGTIFGALIGALVMGVINNGMSIIGLASDRQMVIKGLVLLVAVAFDILSKSKSRQG